MGNLHALRGRSLRIARRLATGLLLSGLTLELIVVLLITLRTPSSPCIDT